MLERFWWKFISIKEHKIQILCYFWSQWNTTCCNFSCWRILIYLLCKKKKKKITTETEKMHTVLYLRKEILFFLTERIWKTTCKWRKVYGAGQANQKFRYVLLKLVASKIVKYVLYLDISYKLLGFCIEICQLWLFNLFFTEKEILDRNEEKNELAKALSRSYEELQKARTASAQVNSQLSSNQVYLYLILI